MPVKVVKRGDEYCVCEPSGKVVSGGCHSEEGDAKDHAAAINANIEKDMTEKDCDGCGDGIVYADDSVELSLSDRFKNFLADHLAVKAEKKCKTIGGKCHPKGDFACNGSENPSEWQLPMTKTPGGPPDMGRLSAAAAAFSEGGHRGQPVKLHSSCSEGAVKAKLRGAYKRLGKEPPESIKSLTKESGFMTFKDVDGTWRWIGIVSNNWQDRHGQWITQEALRDFVDLIDNGLYAKEISSLLEDQERKETLPPRLIGIIEEIIERGTPDHWVWHLPVPVGIVETVAYDERGFLLAAGKQREGELYSKVYEALSKSDDPLGMSHGMPAELVAFDDEEGTTFGKFVSLEFTTLPLDEAANVGTGFGTFLLKELDMKVPDRKKKWFEETFGEDTVAQLDVLLSELQEVAETIGIPTKEVTMSEVEQPTVEETAETTAEVEETVVTAEQHGVEATETPEESTQEQPQFIPASESGIEANVVIPVTMAEFASEIQKGIKEIVSALRSEIAAVNDRIGTLEKQLETNEQQRQAEIQRAIQETPMASFSQWMTKSAVGDPAARLSPAEQSGLANARPTAPAGDSRQTYLNPMLASAPPIIQNLVSKQVGNRTPLRIGPFANGGQNISREGDE